MYTFSTENGITLIHVQENVYTNFDFYTFFLFLTYQPVRDIRIDRQKDGQRDGQTAAARHRKGLLLQRSARVRVRPRVRVRARVRVRVRTRVRVRNLGPLRWQTGSGETDRQVM